MTEAKPKRLCIIGAGPSGLSVLYHFARYEKEGMKLPEIVCYEKQEVWGGLWNFTWRTGLDQYGEKVHGSMYKYLWSNGPKECLEFPDYTFEKHFGRPIPSFPPREVLRDYLKGRFHQYDIFKWIKYRKVVKNVQYNPDTDRFCVQVKDLENNKMLDCEYFEYVIAANGHFSTPVVPDYPGLNEFPGRVMHTHDFRNASEFAGKKLLIIGSSYSAEDVALQCLKYGSDSIIISWRTKPMGFKWPKGIEERPLLTGIQGKKVSFTDGTSAEVDAVIFATGYQYSYEFLPNDLHLDCKKNSLYPPNLYKGMIWLNGGNNKLYYVGAQDQYYTFTMFDIQALWVVQTLLGKIKLPPQERMRQDEAMWCKKFSSLKDCHDEIDFQTEYMADLVKETNFPYNLDTASMFNVWEDHKAQDILSYRDQSFTSIFTGTKSPVHHTKFMDALDDSLECFLNQPN